MHFEILVEGQSELTALSIFMYQILGEYGQIHTWRIHKHQGIGKLPEEMRSSPNVKDRTLLHNLPSKLRAYGREMGKNEAVVVLVDLDDRQDCIEFKGELEAVLEACENKPAVLFRIAIEELEAWYLGDQNAILAAYPEANIDEFESYVQDEQCGTWEKLAEVVYPGGYNQLISLGKRSRRVLEEKRKWAAAIAPNMDVDENKSHSFCVFRDGIRKMPHNSERR